MLPLRMRHPQAHHAHRHLCHLVGMRVVHERPRPARDEFVDERLAHTDRRLGQSGHAVHAVGQALAVPVDAGVLRQAVGDEQAHPVALHHFDRRSGGLSVVAPQVRLHAGREFAHHGFGHQVEFLDPGVHAPGQGPAVERHDRVVGAAGVGDQRRLGRGLVGAHDLGQRGQRHAADRGGRQGGPGEGRTTQKVSS